MMAFVSTVELTIKLGSRAGRYKNANNSGLSITTDIAGTNKDGGKRYSLRLTIYKNLAKEARFIAGDTIDILFDRDSKPMRGLIARVSNSGWTLSKHNAKSSVLKAAMTHREGMPSFCKSHSCNYVVTAEGVLFDLPEDCSFTENLRELIVTNTK